MSQDSPHIYDQTYGHGEYKGHGPHFTYNPVPLVNENPFLIPVDGGQGLFEAGIYMGGQYNINTVLTTH